MQSKDDEFRRAGKADAEAYSADASPNPELGLLLLVVSVNIVFAVLYLGRGVSDHRDAALSSVGMA